MGLDQHRRVSDIHDPGVARTRDTGSPVVAPDRHVSDGGHGASPAFLAKLGLGPVFIEARLANQRSHRVMLAAFDRAIRQFVLHGFPMTRICTSSAAFAWIALPWGAKMPPLIDRRSPRSIFGLARHRAARVAPTTRRRAVSVLLVRTMSVSSGRRNVELHGDATRALHRGARSRGGGGRSAGRGRAAGLRRSRKRGRADLAGSAGHRDVDWRAIRRLYLP